MVAPIFMLAFVLTCVLLMRTYCYACKGHYYLCVLPSLAIEWTGIAHVTYPIRSLLVRLFKMPHEPEDAVRATTEPTILATIFYWSVLDPDECIWYKPSRVLPREDP